MKPLFIIATLLISSLGVAQSAFESGENLTFTASYNMSGLMTDIAEVNMRTKAIQTSKSNLLHLKCTARTYTKWDGFFKIRDIYESYVSPKTLTPFLYKRDIKEGSYYKFIKYTFDHKAQKVNSIQKKRLKIGGFYDEKKTISIKGNTKDLVSTIYHIRNLDVRRASPGDSETFPVIFDHQENYVTVTYLAKETINTVLGKKECYKLAVAISDSNLLEGKNKNLLWLTADENKIPVFAKFKVAIGSGQLRLKSATGLKH